MSREAMHLLRLRHVFSFALSVFVLLPTPAWTQRDTRSADARLRALYADEWNWRRKEMARRSDDNGEAGAGDHFPRVDAASQQARLAYWMRTLATLRVLRAEAETVLGEVVAHERLLTFIRTEYARKARTTIAATAMPDGAFGWSREEAMDYLRTRAALSDHEITTEVERYIAWPGQALAYKLGELQIRRHRREAEEKLGSKFDQRHFHDAILDHRVGALTGAGATDGAVHCRRGVNPR